MPPSLSKAQESLLVQLSTSLEKGLTSDEVSKRRQDDEGGFNVVNAPVNCPSWICCLLPCIKHIPSMKLFCQIQPDDAEVMRNGRWIRYDAASLVRGDIVRLEAGDIVPADCVCLCASDGSDNSEGNSQVLIDVRHITGEDKPRTVAMRSDDGALKPVQIFYGGHVVQGSVIVVVTAIGPSTLLATLILEGSWPIQENSAVSSNRNEEFEDDEEVGISLISKNAILL